MKAEQTKRTEVEMIFEVLQENRLLNAPPLAADEVQAGRRIADFVYIAMLADKLRVQDSSVMLVCMNKQGKLETPTVYAVEDAETADSALLSVIETEDLQPVGIVISILDRERRCYMLHSEVFEGMEVGKDLMREALQIIEAKHRAGNAMLFN